MTATETAPRTTSIEPGGIEPIPEGARHGSPWQLIATWSSPNLEFATIFVGAIAILYFGLDFSQAVAAFVIGNLIGAITQGVLSTWGPREGLAQMVLGRTAFGLRGNIVPSALMTLMAGIGWFAVNSVSGAFALTTLTGMPLWLSLTIIVVIEVAVAFVGHDLVQLFERFALIVLGIVFLVAGYFILTQAHFDAPGAPGPSGVVGGFLLAATAAFGYTAGWNPYAADYSRYLPTATGKGKIALAAGLGNFVSTTFLMIVGAASVTIGAAIDGSPTDQFTSHLPGPVASVTLLAIAVGAIAANALNIYSGAMSFLAMGVKLDFRLRRAIVALAFGVIGFLVALSALADAGATYENFLLVISYWIAPWLGIVLVDRMLRRGTAIATLVTEQARYRNAAGLISLLVGIVVSVAFFSNQALYVGVVPKAVPMVGDITAIVGFILAGGLYAILFTVMKPARGEPEARV